MMIGAIGGYDSIFSIGYSARAAAAGTDFRVPASTLTAPAQEAESVGAVPAYDPIQDSVELSRDYPQMLVGQTYAPPMEQQIASAIRGAPQPGGLANGDESGDYLNNDSSALYGDLEAVEVEEGAGAAGGGEEGEEPVVDETGQEQTDGQGNALSQEQQDQVKELSQTDREVRAHEQAHKSVGGQYAGGMSFEYQQGPDGQRYAVGGEVSIDVSAASDPSQTISKMQQVKAAAMAPANPSAQDYKVAAQAGQTETEARRELREQQTEELQGSEEGEDAGTGDARGIGRGEGEDAEAAGGVTARSSADDSASSASSVQSSGGATASLRANASDSQFAARYGQMSAVDSAYRFTGTDYAIPANYRSINIVA